MLKYEIIDVGYFA